MARGAEPSWWMGFFTRTVYNLSVGITRGLGRHGRRIFLSIPEKGDGHVLCDAPERPLAAKGACHLFPVNPSAWQIAYSALLLRNIRTIMDRRFRPRKKVASECPFRDVGVDAA